MKSWSSVLVLAACLLLVVQMAGAKPQPKNKKQHSRQSATTCTCGQSKKGRMIGGKKSLTNQYPWIAMLVLRETLQQFCGSVIVTEKVAFTAGHCSQVAKGVKISVVAGTSDSKEPKRGQIVEVEKTIEPSDFYSPDKEYYETVNDISILLLATPLKFDANVGPICLPTGKMNLDGKFVKILGWGRINPTDKVNNRHLMEVDVQVMEFDKCKAKTGLKEPQKQICTLSSSKGTCWGDTGSPAVYLDPDTKSYVLAGIVSFMDMECKTTVPTVSTDVSAYLTWIESQIKTLGCHKVEKDKPKSKQGDSVGPEVTKEKKAENDDKKSLKSGKKSGPNVQKKGKTDNKKEAEVKKTGSDKKKGATKKEAGKAPAKTDGSQKKTGTPQKKTGTKGKKSE